MLLHHFRQMFSLDFVGVNLYSSYCRDFVLDDVFFVYVDYLIHALIDNLFYLAIINTGLRLFCTFARGK